MANQEAGTSGHAARAVGGEYEVFLSFRGPDTRYGFTDFLYHGLRDAGVRVFRDEEELRVGEVISGNLLCAIDNSMIYIPIFSRAYASSKWCLRELARMVDNTSKSQGKKIIFPIFLDVEPEDLKLKTPLYRDVLLEQANKFPHEVEAWRKALAEVDEIKGLNIRRDRSQAESVKLVVNKVLEKLELKQKSVTEHLVGLDDQVKRLTELLDVNHPDVRLIGIYGMGGIGKTTLAKVVFNKLSPHFGKCCSFLENIRESMSTMDGIVKLQKRLLSDIVDSGCAKGVENSEQGMQRIGNTLSTKKVLLVLDDVEKKERIKELTGSCLLPLGSRIIITTRDIAVLQVKFRTVEIIPYEMPKMEHHLALQLFCQHAFGWDFPPDDYQELSSAIVSSSGGLPLFIEVMGSLLNGRDEAFWEEALDRLRNVPEEEILQRLKISYEDLDEYQRQIFLDIACFFCNESKTDAIYMWNDCQFYPERGIVNLTSKCLIKILDNDKFWMHDQLIEMGRQIVRQESPTDLGKQSRLWIAKEVLEIIKTEERKDNVKALEINGLHDPIEITNEMFERLRNLRFLKLLGGTCVGDFRKCFSQLRWISMSDSWMSCQDFRACNMHLDHLVVCKLSANCFRDDSKVWELIKRAPKLKDLYLTHCYGITTIPDLSRSLGLERLTIADCDNIKRIESSIGNLRSLIMLKIERCGELTSLPEEMGALVRLKSFSLHGCSGLRELPGSLEDLTSFIELDLSYMRLARFPDSNDTRIHGCHLPRGISNLVNLEELDLDSVIMRGEIPVEIGGLSSLRILKLRNTDICGIPLDGLPQLEKIAVINCELLQRFSIPLGVTKLCHVLVSRCPKLIEMQVVGLPKSLECLEVFQCNSLRRIGGIPYLKNLKTLKIQWCDSLSNIEGLDELEFLKCLTVCECPSLRSLIDASCTCIPDNCLVTIRRCGYSVKNSMESMPLKRYVEEILLSKLERHFTVVFHLGLKKSSEWSGCFGGIKREKKYVVPSSVTYKGLIADVQGFGFRLKRMCYETPGEFHDLLIEIKSDEQVKEIVQLASKRQSFHLYVEGGVDSEWDGDYDDQMMEMLSQEWAMKTDVYFEMDGPEMYVSSPDEVSDSASVGESETDVTTSIDDFQSKPGNAECFETTRNRRQMGDGRVEHSGNVIGGKTISMENRKKGKDRTGEPTNQNDAVLSSWQRCEGVEHNEISCKATTGVEDEGASSYVEKEL